MMSSVFRKLCGVLGGFRRVIQIRILLQVFSASAAKNKALVANPGGIQTGDIERR
jgi:hypothetical protein